MRQQYPRQPDTEICRLRDTHTKGVGEGAQRGKERGRACAAARENVRAREADRNKVRDKDRLRNSG